MAKKKKNNKKRLSFKDMVKEVQQQAVEDEKRAAELEVNAIELGDSGIISAVKNILEAPLRAKKNDDSSIENGEIFLVATPIGNLEDITLRALKVLQSCDIIAAEDTRQTRKLLSYFEIHDKHLESLHIHNEHGKTNYLLDKVVEKNLKMAIVSDAGTPCIADPGFFTVREAVQKGVKINIIPGVSAVTFAAVAAALPVDKFTFDGFIPVKSGRKTAFFEAIKADDKTHIMFESPHRIAKTIKMICEIVGVDTPMAIIREATKVYEETIHGTANELLDSLQEKNWKGELVVVISPQNL
ncbi:16S rRNA (cytidine(1402)-2'-O)-methyltransferase [Lentisphaerota bacterium WC36G]|nr:16S rRNA (cytidine(1402)-2'-O)-methyltransferase [Lentisphaerae bacterium WC36]